MPNLQEHVKNIGFANKPVFCSPLGFDPDNHLEENLSINNPFIDLLTFDLQKCFKNYLEIHFCSEQ